MHVSFQRLVTCKHVISEREDLIDPIFADVVANSIRGLGKRIQDMRPLSSGLSGSQMGGPPNVKFWYAIVI